MDLNLYKLTSSSFTININPNHILQETTENVISLRRRMQQNQPNIFTTSSINSYNDLFQNINTYNFENANSTLTIRNTSGLGSGTPNVLLDVEHFFRHNFTDVWDTDYIPLMLQDYEQQSQLENVKVVLSENEFEDKIVKQRKKRATAKGAEEYNTALLESSCGICQESPRKRPVYLKGCKHLYCYACIRQQLTKYNVRCPVCRKDTRDPEQDPEQEQPQN